MYEIIKDCLNELDQDATLDEIKQVMAEKIKESKLIFSTNEKDEIFTEILLKNMH